MLIENFLKYFKAILLVSFGLLVGRAEATQIRCDIALSERLQIEESELLIEQLADLKIALAEIPNGPHKARLNNEFDRKLRELSGLSDSKTIAIQLAEKIKARSQASTKGQKVQLDVETKEKERQKVKEIEFIASAWNLPEVPAVVEWGREGQLLLAGLQNSSKTFIRDYSKFEEHQVNGFVKSVDDKNGVFITTTSNTQGPTMVYSLKDFRLLFSTSRSFGQYDPHTRLLVTRDGNSSQAIDLKSLTESPAFRCDTVSNLVVSFDSVRKSFVTFQNAVFNQKLFRIQSSVEEITLNQAKLSELSSKGILLTSMPIQESTGGNFVQHWVLLDLHNYDSSQKAIAHIKQHDSAAFTAEGTILIDKENTHSGSSNVFRVYDVSVQGAALTTFRGHTLYPVPGAARVAFVSGFDQGNQTHLVDLQTGKSLKSLGEFQVVDSKSDELILLRKSAAGAPGSSNSEFLFYDPRKNIFSSVIEGPAAMARVVGNGKILQLEGMNEFYFYDIMSARLVAQIPVTTKNRNRVRISDNLKFYAISDTFDATIQIHQLK